MEDVKAKQRYRLSHAVRRQNLDDDLSEGDCLNEFHTGVGGPYGKLVHGQKISGIGFKKRQAEQKKTDDPIQFPGFSKGAGENHPQGVQEDKYQECIRCQAVKTANV